MESTASLVFVLLALLVRSVKPTSMNVLPILVRTVACATTGRTPLRVLVCLVIRVCCVQRETLAFPILVVRALLVLVMFSLIPSVVSVALASLVCFCLSVLGSSPSLCFLPTLSLTSFFLTLASFAF
jgi:hypothetical protein